MSAILFIDGQYLTHIERYFDIKVEYPLLAQMIAKTRGVLLEQVYYYTAPPFMSSQPTHDERSRKAGYDRFISSLRSRGIIVREGRCQRIGTTYTQKGVDTLLTIDLIRIQQKHVNARTALVLTADTDFVPAIHAATIDGIDVVLVYARERARTSRLNLSNALLAACPNRIRITRTMLEDTKK